MPSLNKLTWPKFGPKEPGLPYYTTDKLVLPFSPSTKGAKGKVKAKPHVHDEESQWDEIHLCPHQRSLSKPALRNFCEAVRYCVGRVVAGTKTTHEKFLIQHPMRRAILINIVIWCAGFLVLASFYHGLRHFADI
ncbi:hypothetical protein PG993_010969 [Apiospora rasikravindrae]|uniref:Uncharacterized protein n=1 Tax=Apiospora rasikravindrae TaxID=990691 RepID=A0ABR1SCX0_9PEZI